MGVKKIKFINLDTDTLSYIAVGGIRFYDEAGTLVPSGAVITNGSTSGEFDNFTVSSSSTYNSSNYYVGHAFDTAKLQTGVIYSDKAYWLAATATPEWLEVSFKTEQPISKIEFVPLPDSTYTNRGVTINFSIEAYDALGSLLQSYAVTPITTNDTIQSISTPEIAITNKYLFKDGTDIKKYIPPIDYSVKYEGDVLPNNASPAWAVLTGGLASSSISSSNGILKIHDDSTSGYYSAQRANVVDSTKVIVVESRVKISADSSDGPYIAIRDGVNYLRLYLKLSSLDCNGQVYSVDMTQFHVVKLIKNGTTGWELYVDDVFALSGTNFYSTTTNDIIFGGGTGGGTGYSEWDYVYYSLDGEPQPASWSVIGAAPATKAMFDTDGMTDLSVLDNNAIQALTSTTPELLCWTDEEAPTGGTVSRTASKTAIPNNKLLMPTGDINVGEIESVLLSSTISGTNTDLKVITSTDGGVSWKAFDDSLATPAWATVDHTLLSDVKAKGMTPTKLNSLTATTWSMINTSGLIRFAFYAEQEKSTDTVSIQDLSIKTAAGWQTVKSSLPTDSEFNTSGMDGVSSIPKEVLSSIQSDYNIYAYTPDTAQTTMNLNYKAIPNPKFITPTKDIDLTNMTNIDYFNILANESGAGAVRLVASVDQGATWKAWDGVSWITVDTSVLSNIKTNGMTPTVFNGVLSANWNSLRGTSNTIRFGYYLEIQSLTDVANTDELKVQYDIEGSYDLAIPGTDYTYRYKTNSAIEIEFFTSGDFKINYAL